MKRTYINVCTKDVADTSADAVCEKQHSDQASIGEV